MGDRVGSGSAGAVFVCEEIMITRPSVSVRQTPRMMERDSTMFRKLGASLLATAMTVVHVGCETMTERGALGGAALGAAAGALVGSQTADAGKGALIGGALGTVAGALTGSAIDRAEDRATERAIRASQAESAMTVADIVSMAQSGVAEDTILASIRSTSSSFQLAAADVVHLHNSGVSDRVIQAMMDKRPVGWTHRRPIVVHEPAPVYIYEPYPRPFVVGYHHHCW